MLLTQGLGKQPFHGHMAVLINEWTSSAGEMAAQFAKDTKLATLIGQKTAGLVLGSEMFDVGKMAILSICRYSAGIVLVEATPKDQE